MILLNGSQLVHCEITSEGKLEFTAGENAVQIDRNQIDLLIEFIAKYAE